jgi:hypothetical protein
MKTSQFSSLLLGAASGALAQDYTTSPAFTLSISDAANATLNGYVLEPFHAGAAIEALGISAPPTDGSAAPTYNFNYTVYQGQTTVPTGVLFWTLTAQGSDGPVEEQEPLSFLYNPGSNVALPLFEPSYTNVQLGFDADNKLFAVGYSDSSFSATTRPNVTYDNLYHWEACYNYFEGYYYPSIGFVTAGTPSNPTCSAVNITRTFVN